jgi:hypothetical protein
MQVFQLPNRYKPTSVVGRIQSPLDLIKWLFHILTFYRFARRELNIECRSNPPKSHTIAELAMMETPIERGYSYIESMKWPNHEPRTYPSTPVAPVK